MKYLGIKPKKPNIAVFDFTCCEGCELQFVNKEETLVSFLQAINIINFREVTSTRGEDYEIAFIEGAISRSDEVNRLLKIRQKAKQLIALGSCACFGGINRLKNAFKLDEINKVVYGEYPKETMTVRAVKEIVPVDLEIPGCPVSKDEVERIVQHIVWDIPWHFPSYPVCYECKQRFTVCRIELGELCLGPITRGGCRAPCPAGGLSCWGCRGPAEDANMPEFLRMAADNGFNSIEINERLHFFGGFEEMIIS